MIQKQVIVQWYTVEENTPEDDIAVVATVSGVARGGLSTFQKALVIMFYNQNEGWYSLEYDFEELTVHAWCDLDAYGG